MKSPGCESYAEFAPARCGCSNDSTLQNKIVDAITTNETLFFRDSSPFDALQNKVIPETIDGKAGSLFPKRLRIWSAACSTGQEPYSIAMMLSEMLPDVHVWDINILGTDISDDVVARASRGWYAPRDRARHVAGAAAPVLSAGERRLAGEGLAPRRCARSSGATCSTQFSARESSTSSSAATWRSISRPRRARICSCGYRGADAGRLAVRRQPGIAPRPRAAIRAAATLSGSLLPANACRRASNAGSRLGVGQL